MRRRQTERRKVNLLHLEANENVSYHIYNGNYTHGLLEEMTRETDSHSSPLLGLSMFPEKLIATHLRFLV